MEEAMEAFNRLDPWQFCLYTGSFQQPAASQRLDRLDQLDQQLTGQFR